MVKKFLIWPPKADHRIIKTIIFLNWHWQSLLMGLFGITSCIHKLDSFVSIFVKTFATHKWYPFLVVFRKNKNNNNNIMKPDNANNTSKNLIKLVLTGNNKCSSTVSAQLNWAFEDMTDFWPIKWNLINKWKYKLSWWCCCCLYWSFSSLSRQWKWTHKFQANISTWPQHIPKKNMETFYFSTVFVRVKCFVSFCIHHLSIEFVSRLTLFFCAACYLCVCECANVSLDTWFKNSPFLWDRDGIFLTSILFFAVTWIFVYQFSWCDNNQQKLLARLHFTTTTILFFFIEMKKRKQKKSCRNSLR